MMGYFPNGTAGGIFQETHCAKCHHAINEDCPVWLAHLMHNYDECNKDDSILHLLIPKDSRTCNMFIPRLGKIEDAS